MIDVIEKLQATLSKHSPLAIAVSGGVDSLTLAWVANLNQADKPIIVHAVSPAVPPEATALVKRYAKQANWQLEIIDAEEYNDERYRRNPVNRCYYCKTNLYARIKEHTGLTIASGTNTDDLGDYRPGLEAASQHGVMHPFVETGIDKQAIRKIAAYLGLHDVAELPAQPCLASRVETGITIDANDLSFINSMERMLRSQLGNGDIRCRLIANGVKIEIEPALLNHQWNKDSAQKNSLEQLVKQACITHHRTFCGITEYKRGSAFIHPVSSLTS